MYLIAIGNIMYEKICEFWITDWNYFIKESTEALKNLIAQNNFIYRPHLGIYIFFNHNWITDDSKPINYNPFIIPARHQPHMLPLRNQLLPLRNQPQNINDDNYNKSYIYQKWLEEDEKHLKENITYIQNFYEEQDENLKIKNETYLKLIWTNCRQSGYEIPYFVNQQMKSYSPKLNQDIVLDDEENFQYIKNLIYSFNNNSTATNFKDSNKQKKLTINYKVSLHQNISKLL